MELTNKARDSTASSTAENLLSHLLPNTPNLIPLHLRAERLLKPSRSRRFSKLVRQAHPAPYTWRHFLFDMAHTYESLVLSEPILQMYHALVPQSVVHTTKGFVENDDIWRLYNGTQKECDTLSRKRKITEAQSVCPVVLPRQGCRQGSSWTQVRPECLQTCMDYGYFLGPYVGLSNECIGPCTLQRSSERKAPWKEGVNLG